MNTHLPKHTKRIKRNSTKKLNFLHVSFRNLFHPHRGNHHRAKILHPESIFYLGLIVIGIFSLIQAVRFFPGLKDSILGFSSEISADKVLEKTNLERQKMGLSTLTYNDKLAAAALSKAQNMFDQQYWSHNSPDGHEPWFFINQAGYVYQVAGENLARDFQTTDQMVSAWMESPTHRANIVNDKFTEIGVAVVDGRLQGFETTLVVQMFGSPGSDLSQLVANQPKSVVFAEDGQQAAFGQASILAGQSPVRIFSQSSPIFNPLHLTKAFFLAVVFLIIMTLIYDGLVSNHKKLDRVVGHNFAHIILFSTIAFLLIFFKGGIIQ
ncbi:MAG: CAP domain-containing protein [Patescibacteria group bacterium]